MLRVFIPVFLISAALAQVPVPPEVEAALRARVTGFFQDQVDNKFRQAEEFIANDTKDFFYNSSKPNYVGFEIKRVEFSPDQTKASVLVMINRQVMVQGFEGHPISQAMASHWKLEDGKWCWYMDPAEQKPLPFPGMGAPAGMPMPGVGAPAAPGTPGVPGAPVGVTGNARLPPMPNMSALVRPDKPRIELVPGKPSTGQITLSSQLRFPVTLILRGPKVDGVTSKLDHTDLKPGDKAVIDIRSDATVKPSADPIPFDVVVKQTNQIVKLSITFAQPAPKK